MAGQQAGEAAERPDSGEPVEPVAAAGEGVEHQPGALPAAQPPAEPAGELVELGRASRLLGRSPEALRKRIRRGTLAGEQRGGRYFVRLPVTASTSGGALAPSGTGSTRPDSAGVAESGHVAAAEGSTGAALAAAQAEAAHLRELVAVLRAQHGELLAAFQRHQRETAGTLAALRAELGAELEARRREVSELHVLLQRAQEAIPPPHVRPAQLAAPEAAGQGERSEATPAAPPRAAESLRSWWRRVLGR
jgi:hypothetical protein